ncbi:Uncharacterised protein [Staphylococcus aureus]|nr:Uncharacterised protein [Staphylococcus aureus]
MIMALDAVSKNHRTKGVLVVLESCLRYLDYLSISQKYLVSRNDKSQYPVYLRERLLLYTYHLILPKESLLLNVVDLMMRPTIESPQDKKHHLFRYFHYSMAVLLPIQSLRNNLPLLFLTMEIRRLLICHYRVMQL